MFPRLITSFVFMPLCGAALVCASPAGAAQAQTKDTGSEVRCADEGQWKRVPGGSRPAYAGIQGGTVPVSLLQASNGTIFVIPGRTGNDFTHVLRGSPDNATQAVKPADKPTAQPAAAKPLAQAANATQPIAAVPAATAQAVAQPAAAKPLAQAANATQPIAAVPAATAQAGAQPAAAKPLTQAANATQPIAAVPAATAQAGAQPAAAKPLTQAANATQPIAAAPAATAQGVTQPGAENSTPKPTPTPQTAPKQLEAASAHQAVQPEGAPTAQPVPQSEAAKPVAQAGTTPKAASPASKPETAPAAEGTVPNQAPAAVQAQAEPVQASRNDHVVFASSDLAARLREEPELAPFGLTADATEVEQPEQQARPVAPSRVAVFKPLRLGSYTAVLAKR